MSRIGLKPITVPQGVEIKVNDGVVTVKGPKGELKENICKDLTIKIEDGILNVERPNDEKKIKALHGLTRSLIHNMVTGVTEGFSKELTIIGTGYRAQKNGNKLALTLGFSHPLELEDPEGITVEVPEQDKIVVKGLDKQKVGQYAAYIRTFRMPEPYKGKGIRYTDEYVRRKVGKTGK